MASNIVVINGQRFEMKPHYVVEAVPFGYRMTWAEKPAFEAAHPELAQMGVRWRLVGAGTDPKLVAFLACFAGLGAVAWLAKRKSRRAKAAA